MLVWSIGAHLFLVLKSSIALRLNCSVGTFALLGMAGTAQRVFWAAAIIALFNLQAALRIPKGYRKMEGATA